MPDCQRFKHITFMDIAAQLAKLGTCDRSHVGAVIVHSGRCISWGYNGAPPGAPHCEENMHGWEEQAANEVYEWEGTGVLNTSENLIRSCADESIGAFGCRNATHAEANALAFAARQGISTDGATLYVTLSPCETCTRLLIAAGIRCVYYAKEYRDTSGLDLLRQAEVEAHHLPLA